MVEGMNIVSYSIEMEMLRQQLGGLNRVMKHHIKNNHFTAAKERCEDMRMTVRKMELLQVQYNEELSWQKVTTKK